jgi:aminoglycoside phosphotransferase (APT) family kinase protein
MAGKMPKEGMPERNSLGQQDGAAALGDRNDNDAFKGTLQTYIRSQPGYGAAVITDLVPLPGGASKETWSFDLICDDDVLTLVLRINRSFPLPMALDLASEFKVMEAVYAAGIPVPRPFWYSEEVLEAPFYVLERIPGETLVRRLQRDEAYRSAREVLPVQLGRALAGIHRIPSSRETLGFLPYREQGGSAALGELSFYEGILRKHAPEPHPALELAIRWLRQNAPTARQISLVHGDYRLGNIIFSPEGLTRILDWELAHLGDPMEDLGYISVQAWRFGRVELPVGGIGKREVFLEAYAQAGGFPLDLETIRYWEVMGNFKWAVIKILQAAPFLTGQSDSIELASLGRKTAETELQILTLIEGA